MYQNSLRCYLNIVEVLSLVFIWSEKGTPTTEGSGMDSVQTQIFQF